MASAKQIAARRRNIVKAQVSRIGIKYPRKPPGPKLPKY